MMARGKGNAMADLIDRGALREVLAKRVPYAIVTSDDTAFAYGLDAAYCAVMEAPTVDAEPVRRGAWIPCQAGSAKKCSECGSARIFWDSCLRCPNCGARMEEVSE